MANQIKAPINYPVIAGGKIVSGGSVLFGQPNVKPDEENPSTLKAVYLDAALSQPASNPQGLSSDGVFDQSDTGILFGPTDSVYSIVIKAQNGKELSYIPEYDLSDSNAAQTAQDAATAAAASESNALTYKNLVDALYTDFVNRYFGAYSSDPTVDAKGNPPNEGSIYFNSTSNVFYTWTDGAWVNHFPSNPNGLLVTATGTTTPRTLGDRFADVVNVKNYTTVQEALDAVSQDNTLVVGYGSYTDDLLQAPDFTITLRDFEFTSSAAYVIKASSDPAKLLNVEKCKFNKTGGVAIMQHSTWTPTGKAGFVNHHNLFNLSGGAKAFSCSGIWSGMIHSNICIGSGKTGADIFIDTVLGSDLNTSVMNLNINNNIVVTCEKTVRLVPRVGDGRIEGIGITNNNFIASDIFIESTQTLAVRVLGNQLSDCNYGLVSNGDFNYIISGNCEIQADVIGITINTLSGSIADSVHITNNNMSIESGAIGIKLKHTNPHPLMRNLVLLGNNIGKIGSQGGTALVIESDDPSKIKAVLNSNNFYNLLNGVDFGSLYNDVEYKDNNTMELVTNELINVNNSKNPKVKLSRNYSVVSTLSSGLTTETFNINISSLGLSSRPENVYVNLMWSSVQGSNLSVRYDYGASTSTNLVMVFSLADGTNLPTGGFRYTVRVDYEKDIEGNKLS